jgi:ribosomal protein S18 acetylase RimI-like enzyme
VGLRDLGQGTCEMKRLFVDAGERGTGVGRLLVNCLLEEARAAGYARMRLDTSHYQPPAQRLYESVGFQRIQPYYDVPAELRDWLLYYECNLTVRASRTAGALGLTFIGPDPTAQRPR